MIRPLKSDTKDKKANENYTISNYSTSYKLISVKDKVGINTLNTNVKIASKSKKNKKSAWISTFIYVNPQIEKPIEVNVFYSIINKKIFKKICNYAQIVLKKKQEQEAMDEILRSKKNSFSFGDLFPSSRLFKKKRKEMSEPSADPRLVVSLTSTEIHPYFTLSTNEEIKKHPHIKFQINKFNDNLFNQDGLPPWIYELEFENSENSESETDVNLNIDSALLVDLYNDRLKLLSADHKPSYSMFPFRENVSVSCELDFLFKWEYIVSNTIRSLVAIIEDKDSMIEKSETSKNQNDKGISFKPLPTYYLAFNRERPYKKYIKVPYICTKILKSVEKEELVL
ncbi:Hypothetical protein SRAE_2000043200 [Strongyloides ratti]|uniref:Uncharacterized protein n=1 Tax=Strongyloides ratti TaxID=34506 RepID=A0A090L7K2_STRRB|nr:Hypothetical protein SRAE_2000043200 [Strongyloides ratti]CEF65756.1 Hypothetical protein SRAE_2000043200 [Strongyloides ratti]